MPERGRPRPQPARIAVTGLSFHRLGSVDAPWDAGSWEASEPDLARVGTMNRRILGRSAELHSAVSQNWILRGVALSERPGTCRHPADCKSAIRQIENQRYGDAVHGKPPSPKDAHWDNEPRRGGREAHAKAQSRQGVRLLFLGVLASLREELFGKVHGTRPKKSAAADR